MLDKLNEDCVLEILKNLNINDEISLAQVNRRFKVLIDARWAKRFKKLELGFKIMTWSSIEFRVLLRSICGGVTSVFLQGVTTPLFAVLTEFKFQAAEELQYFGRLTDHDMLLLLASFPHIKTLSLNGWFTGKYIALWRKLENINLSKCYNLKFEHFCDIVRVLPLKTLVLDMRPSDFKEVKLNNDVIRSFNKIEKLSLKMDEFFWITDNTDPFKNLKELTITNGLQMEIYDWIRQFKMNDLSELDMVLNVLHQKFRDPRVFPLDFEKYLTKLTFYLARDSHTLVNLTMSLNAGGLLKLREVVVFNSILESPSDILDFIKSSQHLELVTIEHCKSHFTKLKLCVSDIVHAKRTTPLTVNFNDNVIFNSEGKPLQLDVVGFSDFMKVTYKKLIGLDFDSYSSTFTFK